MTIITMPSYRGSKKFLGSNYAPSGYFEHTEVKKWSLSHFLTSYSTESEFLDGLVLINKNKSVDTCVRGFAWSLHTYYSGAMGYWRQVLCRKIASNNIKRASLTQSHISAALSQEETLTEQLELSVTHHHELPNNDTETDTILGKRARVDDDGNNDETEEDGYVRMNKMHQNPLLSEDDGAVEGEDPVSLAQARSRLAMNIVFELDNFAFTATLDGIDFGKEFTSYYEDCQSLQYDADNLADFVALSGVLMLDERPTHLQKTHLGAKYKQLWDLIGNRAVYPTQEDIDEALKICRDAKDAYMKSPSKRVDATASRTRMEESIEKAPKSTLRSLLLYGSRLHKICTPFSEADQTSQFILGTLSPIMNRPDETRIAHTATAPATGSLLVRVYLDLEQSPRHPDVLVKYLEAVDIGVGEASLAASFEKDQGDLARIMMWSKRSLDEISTRFEGVDDMIVLSMQIIGQTCDVYLMCRVGTACVASKICTMKILVTLSDALSFEDQVGDWLTLEKTFNRSVDILNNAPYRRRDSAPPPCFPGISTPRSRKMKSDGNRGRM